MPSSINAIEDQFPDYTEIEYSKDDIRNLVRIANPAILILNQSLQVRKFTPGLAQRWRLTDPNAIIGMHLRDVPAPWSGCTKLKILELASETLRTSQTSSTEAVDLRGNIELNSFHPYQSENENTKGVVISIKDISELKIKEGALAHSRAELVKAHEIASLGSWTWDLETDEVRWTAELFRIFGMEPATRAPSFAEQEQYYLGDSWERLNATVNHSFATGSPYEIELNLRTANGDEAWMKAYGAVEKNSAGQPVKLRGIAQNITAQKKIEKQLLDAIRQAESANKYKDQFIANMSHEIRTPLNGIAGFSSLLRDEHLSHEQRNHYLDVIHECTESLLAFINDLMDLSKIEAGEMTISVVECRPYEILLLCQETYTVLANRKGNPQTRYLIEVPEEDRDFLTLCDPRRLQQVLTNLLDNASKYGQGDDIEFGYRRLDGDLEFFVRDKGIGISSKGVEKIFERFNRAQNIANLYEGSGLGLSLSKAIVDLLGGSISVTSNPGMGAEFKFRIPCQPVEGSADRTKIRDWRISTQKSLEFLAGTKILVCEDDETNRMFYQALLSRAGIEVFFAQNGEIAVKLAHHHPDLEFILMDIRLPVIDGIQAAKLIRKSGNRAKIIALSASYMSNSDRHRLRNLFCEIITKPIDTDLLLDKLAALKDPNKA